MEVVGVSGGEIAGAFGGEVGVAHEEGVDGSCGFTAFADGPDDEGLAAAHVAADEDGGGGGGIIVAGAGVGAVAGTVVGAIVGAVVGTVGGMDVGTDVAAVVEVAAELGDDGVGFGADESHGEEDEIGRPGFFGAGPFAHFHAGTVGNPFDLYGVEADDAAVAADEAFGGEGPAAVASLLVGAGGTELHGEVGPGLVFGPAGGRLWEQLELGDGFCVLPVGGADAVGAGVAPADDDDVFSGGEDVAVMAAEPPPAMGPGSVVSGDAFVLLWEELHGEVDAVEVSAWDGQVSGSGGTAAEDNGVEVGAEPVAGDVAADVDGGAEDDSLGLHQRESSVEDVFFELEVGDAVSKEPADAVGAFEDGDGVAGAVELLRGGEAGRAA